MKTLITTLILFLAFSAFGTYNVRRDWSVTYEKVKTMAKTDTKVMVHSHFRNEYVEKPDQILYGYSGSGEGTQTSANLDFTLTPEAGMHTFQFYASGSFGDGSYREIETDSIEVKAGVITHIHLHFQYEEIMNEVKKPVIYLYPEATTDVAVNLKPTGALTFTYPQLNDNWKVTAQPDGTLTCDGKNYPYLFWEADQHVQNPFELGSFEGFVVEGKNAVSFLEGKLTQIGLNDRERTDFITFWGPQLAKNEFNNVTFQFNETCDAYGTLDISPKPEHVNRVYLVWSKTDASAPDGMITPQELPVFDRSGFDVLEWGGVEILNVEL